MNRYDFKCLPLHLVGISALVGAVACGGVANEEPQVQEERIERRAASLHVTTTLDTANLLAPSVADRVQVDEILINLSEVRMLGADPRIPADGVPLLTEERIVRSTTVGLPAIELKVPKYLLDDPELSVFLRVSPSEALNGASVVVRGRYDVGSGGISTTRAYGEATDPDVDPMHDGEAFAEDGHGCATDPDVDPMACDRAVRPSKSALDGATSGSRVVVDFELRDEQVVDLLTSLDLEGELNVVLGIPAARWLTPAAVGTLNEASQSAAAPVEQAVRPDGQSELVPFELMPDQPPVDANDFVRPSPSVCPKGYFLDDRSRFRRDRGDY